MRTDFSPTVYLLASKRNGTLYVGVTSDLLGRLHKHRTGLIPGFTRDYDVKRLVRFVQHPKRNSPREAYQEMEPGVEASADRN